ncbi:NYN domain-containing protein [Aeromicrobium ginsengisoli]|uniref:NYN domain-containing protein n=1 Tax=Aeromicrobium ginsengisoli TaxID=363867 RepID=A0A5M4FDW0_9ACTN|nr:NYN domain-containing protein [Aeromicrobium ginsengisoli]KAA1397390.1 NYN domain-containing protein [Aeromicrobium ginsengisoli]
MSIRKNVAVFIDAENLFKGYGKLDIPDVSMEDILNQIDRVASQEVDASGIAVARAYADWNALGLEDYRRDVERSRVETVQVFSVGKAEKNAADIVLVVDCLRVAADLDHIEVFVLVSADGDFVPLVRRLHELDKYVVGATLANHPVNSVLEKEVDQYVALKVAPPLPAGALHPVFSAGEPAKKSAAPRKEAAKKSAAPRKEAAKKAAVAKVEPAKRAAEPKKQAQPKQQAAEPRKKAAEPEKSLPRKGAAAGAKPEWHRIAKEIPVVHAGPASSPEDYKAIMKQVLTEPKVRSYLDQLANHGGTLPILAMAIKAAAPQVSPSNAKVSTLSRALRFALAGTPYALARESDDVQPVLVRRSSKPAGMLPDLSLDDIQRGVQ